MKDRLSTEHPVLRVTWHLASVLQDQPGAQGRPDKIWSSLRMRVTSEVISGRVSFSLHPSKCTAKIYS